MPVRRDYGSTWETYLQEEENSIDVLFFGSSIVYCDVSPGVLWDTAGITSYVMAGPEQTMPITYYYLREACKTQSPTTVVVELTGLFYGDYQSFTQVNIGYMPWSMNRIRATLEAAEPELRLGLLFPLYADHDRWLAVRPQEVLDHLFPSTDEFCGYTPLDRSCGFYYPYERDFSAATAAYARNLSYLQKIASFCSEQGIDLYLYISPTMGRIPGDAQAVLETDLSQLDIAGYWDLNDYDFSFALDSADIWYDTLHFNMRGSVPFSADLAKLLVDSGVSPRADADTALWDQRAAAVYDALAALSP
jgi:hypothetical protein